ncbi:MAG TPA: hypothetical protein VJU14_13140 [Solirubrobacterales bacterium]|nr:hypothetical protein [Solirubrobacterales bacterium]
MNPSAQRNLARAAGALLGLTLAVTLLLVSRPGAVGAGAPAAVSVAIVPVGELEVTPAPPRPVLEARSLRPGGPPASGAFTVRNQTGEDLAVALRADMDSTALNGLLEVRVRSGDRVLSESSLESLRVRPPRLQLASGERADLSIEAWLPSQVLEGYEGAIVDVTLTPRLRTLEGAG